MASIKIEPNPTFDAPVKIPRVGGEPVEVRFTFKYLDRLALAALLDQQRADGEQLLKDYEGRSAEEQAKAEIDAQAGYLEQVVLGWDFDDEFNGDSLRALATTFAGAPDAVLKAYYGAYREARLGN